MSKYYVYRFKNIDDKIIYVGKTNNIRTRMSQHFTSGHLPKECYDSVKEIEFIKLNSNTEMDIYETYFINKYNPRYNTMSNYNEHCLLQLPDVYWQLFSTNNKEHYLEIEKKYIELLNKNKQLEDENKLLKHHIDNTNKTKSYSEILYHNQDAIMFNYEEIEYFYSKLKSKVISFNTELRYKNEVLYDKYKIYYDGDCINIISYGEIDTKSSKPIIRKYELHDKHTFHDFCYGRLLKYVPDNDIVYTVIKSKYEKECNKLKEKYETEYTVEDIIRILNTKKDIFETLIDITNSNTKMVRISNREKIEIINNYKDISIKEFVEKFKYSIFKNNDYEELKVKCNELQEKINKIDKILNCKLKIS